MIKIAKQLFREFEGKAVSELPAEACGLLLGIRGGNDYTVTDIAYSANVSRDDPTRSFEIDPTVYIKLQREARAGGPEIIGVWHSHPYGEAVLSKTDKARSIEPDWVWLITATDGSISQTKGYLSGSDTPNVFTELYISFGG